MRALSFTLGTILVAYCSAGAISETLWPDNVKVNQILCQSLLCNSAPLVWSGRDQLRLGKETNIQQAITTFQTVLKRDPQDPYRWVDLGDAFLEAGRNGDARYCFAQVSVLAPHTAILLLRVAVFHFQIGEKQEALGMGARILALIPDYDSVIFGEYTGNVDRIEEVLQFGLPEDPRAARSWLEFLIQANRLGDAKVTWDWIVAHGFTDDVVSGRYVEFLVRQGHPDWAASAWAQRVRASADDYDESNYLYNGDFESEPAPSPFDWNLTHIEGADVTRDCTNAWAGNCSLKISFLGTKNVGFAAASQLAFVRPGAYRFHALIRTESVTTDEGIRFRISDAEVPARLDDVFGQFSGSGLWLHVDHDLIVAPSTKLLRVEVIRQPSLKFDNKVDGTAWIDQLKLEPMTPPSLQ